MATSSHVGSLGSVLSAGGLMRKGKGGQELEAGKRLNMKELPQVVASGTAQTARLTELLRERELVALSCFLITVHEKTHSETQQALLFSRALSQN